MHIVNRFHKVRLAGPEGLSAPMVFARKRAQWPAELQPYDHVRWIEGDSGIVMPAISGGAGWSGGMQTAYNFLGLPGAAALSQTTTALSTAYVYNSAGMAVAGRWNMPLTKTVTTAYYFVTAFTGTTANVNDVNIWVGDNSTNKPGTTTATTGTSDAGAAGTLGWKATAVTSTSLTQDTIYWAVVNDADGNGTDFATVLRNVSSPTPSAFPALGAAFSTSDGFASAATAATAPSSVLLHFSDATTLGYPFTSSTASASSTAHRGLCIEGLTETIKVFGLVNPGTSLTNPSGLNAWSADNGPNGAANVATGTVDIVGQAAAVTILGYGFTSAVTLAKSTKYRFVFTFSGASTSVIRYQCGTGADAAVRAAMMGGGTWYYTLDNGSGAWTDTNTEFPGVFLIVEDQIAVATGGGPLTGGLLVR